jgi:phage terminase small subunit
MSHKTAAGRGQRTEQPRRPKPATPAPPPDLTTQQYEFCLHYLANGFNATQAYLSAAPGVTKKTASVEGCRYLANPKIRAYISKQQKHRWKALQMGGDEALGRVALDARADPRLLFNGTKLLSPADWPDEVANSIETVEFDEDGNLKRVRMVSKLAARRIVLEQTGKLRSKLEDTMSALAKALRRDLGKDEEADDE